MVDGMRWVAGISLRTARLQYGGRSRRLEKRTGIRIGAGIPRPRTFMATTNGLATLRGAMMGATAWSIRGSMGALPAALGGNMSGELRVETASASGLAGSTFRWLRMTSASVTICDWMRPRA